VNLEAARVLLVEHSQTKRNGKFPALFTHAGKLTNPVCGDCIELKFNLDQNQILEAGFSAQACGICTASASLLCQEIKGLTVQSSLDLGKKFEEALLASVEQTWPEPLLPLASFQHLRVNQSRRACALLPWIALRSTFKEVLL
jgi:nitrogen fixation NifU-like protein